MEKLVLLLAPFAPHMAEELWEALGHTTTLAYEPWPTFDEAALKEDTIEIPIQINGKLRGKISVSADADKAALEAAARSDAKIAELLAGKTNMKAVVVPRRMVSFVEMTTIRVSLDGKPCGEIVVPVGTNEDTLVKKIKADPQFSRIFERAIKIEAFVLDQSIRFIKESSMH